MENTNNSPKTYIGKIFEIILGFFRSLFLPKKNSSKFLRGYIMSIIFGAALLYMPIAVTSYQKTNGTAYTMLDALFTATSAFTDTGLTVTSTASQFTIFGKSIIMFLIFIGGIGIIAVKILLLRMVGRKMGLKEIILFKDERGSSKLGESTQVFAAAFKTILWGTIFGVITLTPYFFFKQQEIDLGTYQNVGKSLWYSLFHSVSAINNAGFDIIGNSSFEIFSNDIWVQLIIIILIVIGGIGFPVLHDVSRYISHKKNKTNGIFKWSLFTKLTVVTYFWIIIIGLALTFTFEIYSQDPNSLWNLSQNSAVISSGTTYTRFEIANSLIFTTFSTRNAGFSIIPISEFQETTKTLWSTLMWIGSSPASTAGGIRTTTFAIGLLAIASTWRKQKSNKVSAFNHTIPAKTVFQALVVIFLSIGLLWLASIILILDTQYTVPLLAKTDLYTFNNIFFEVASAFGTTGLSTGITRMLGDISLWTIMILMIIGQLGVTALLKSLSKNINEKTPENSAVYGEEDVLIS